MFNLMLQGGPLTGVIVACAIAAVAVFLERAFHLHRARIKPDDFFRGIENLILRRNIREAVSICNETPGPVAAIVQAALLNHEKGGRAMRDAMDKTAVAEIARLENRFSWLATLAQITPLLGLLGTVLGMVEVYAAIEQNAPLVHAGALAAGLRHALFTTAFGLATAVLCYAEYNMLVSKMEILVLDMDHAARRIAAILEAAAPAAAQASDAAGDETAK